MDINTQIMGRAKTVLVFGQGDQARAVLSAIVVRMQEAAGEERLNFTGPVGFADSVREHIAEIILPIVDRIFTCLQLTPKRLEISAVNLGAASARDLGVHVSGFSADVAVLLAMLSAGLQIPVPDDIVVTGHIASVGGDIRSVKAIPAKLEAVRGDRMIRRFIYPDPDQDGSMASLSPHEKRLIYAAVMAARDQVRIDAVSGIDELVKSLFTGEAVALSSLLLGFYHLKSLPATRNHPVDEIIRYLAEKNEQRFWQALEKFLLAGQCCKGKELLQAFTRFHIDRQEYARNLGGKLMQLVYSLPPAVRRLRIIFPLLDTGGCIGLSQFAAETDYEDVCQLFEAAHGRFVGGSEPDIPVKDIRSQGPDSDSTVFAAVVSQINEQALAQKFGVPIDSARASYVLDSSTVSSYDQFLDTIEAFFVHLQRYITPYTIIDSTHLQKSRTEALALLERAYQRQGGSQAALAQATDGTEGGLRRILDVLTEQYKSELQTEYVQRIFKEALDGLDWDARVRFMEAALQHLGSSLPPEIKSQPAERFARHYEVIVQAYVQSRDKVNQLLRTL